MRTNLVRLTVVLVVVAAVLGACSPAAQPTPTPVPRPATAAPTAVPPTAVPPTAAPKVLKVGFMTTLTGPNARNGEQNRDAITFAMEQVNWKIGDYTIEPVWIDTEGDPEKAVRAYEQAITRDQIDISVHQLFSSEAVALMDVAARYQIPHFGTQGATGVVTEKYRSDPEKYSYWIMKAWARPESWGPLYSAPIADLIERGVWDPQPKNAVICQVETDWGRSVGAAARSALEADGWKIVAEDYFKDGETEFYPLAGKWRDLDARLIVISDSTVSTSAAVKQAREVGVEALIMAQNLSTLVPEWYSMVGDASDYCLDIISTFSKPEAIVFVEEFEERFGYEPTTGGVGFSYDIALFFIKAANRTIEKYGELTRDTFYRLCMEEVNTGQLTLKEGVTMPEYRYVPETLPEPVVAPDGWTFYGAQLFGGKQIFVWPPSVAEAEIVLPPWLQE